MKRTQKNINCNYYSLFSLFADLNIAASCHTFKGSFSSATSSSYEPRRTVGGSMKTSPMILRAASLRRKRRRTRARSAVRLPRRLLQPLMRRLRRALLMQPAWRPRAFAPRLFRRGAHVLGTAGRLSGVEGGADVGMLNCLNCLNCLNWVFYALKTPV